jgi:membrane protease YdiL (CAAX protease family)
MERIRQRLNALPQAAEFAIVVLVAFGYPVIGNAIETLNGKTAGHISEAHLRFLIGYEFAVLAVLGLFLHLRGWSLHRVGLRPGLRDTGIGLLLAIGAYVASYATIAFAVASSATFRDLAYSADFVAPGFALPTIVVASALNGFFEEVFLCGYMTTVLKDRYGFWAAVNITLALRLSYHLYQGVIGVAGVVPIGFIFGYYCARSGRLWPVVVAHALLDFVALFGHGTAA